MACFPLTTDEVAAAVRIARRHGRPFVARGSGTGLAGGAVPVGDPVVIVTTKMDRILEVDADERVAWVQPGVVNLDLTRALASARPALRPGPVEPAGVHDRRQRGQQLGRAPLPGLRRHVAPTSWPLEVVLPDGTVTVLGGLDAEPAGPRPAGRVRGQRGDAGHRHPHRRAADARSRRPWPRCCSTSRRSAAAAETVSGDHRRRPAARRAGDDGPAHHRGGRGVRPRRLSRPTRPRCCWSSWTACRRAWRPGSSGWARSAGRTGPAPCGWRPTTPSGRCCGRAASRRSGPWPGSRPTTTCTTRWCPGTRLVEVLAEVVRHRRAPRPRAS